MQSTSDKVEIRRRLRGVQSLGPTFQLGLHRRWTWVSNSNKDIKKIGSYPRIKGCEMLMSATVMLLTISLRRRLASVVAISVVGIGGGRRWWASSLGIAESVGGGRRRGTVVQFFLLIRAAAWFDICGSGRGVPFHWGWLKLARNAGWWRAGPGLRLPLGQVLWYRGGVSGPSSERVPCYSRMM